MKRRNFVQLSTVGACALITAPVLYAKVNNPNAVINIGVIGTGERAIVLIKHINEIENLNVIACSDILPSRMQSAINTIDGVVEGYKDYRKLLDNKVLDAVIVATPFSAHAKIVLEAIEGGKHVYCEKTLAKGYQSIANLVSLKNISTTILQTGHQYRSSRLYAFVIDIIRKGEIGAIKEIKCVANVTDNSKIIVHEPHLEKLTNWRFYNEFSGGILEDFCAHQLDFVNWLLNEVPTQVSGVGDNSFYTDGRETFDNILLNYTYPNNINAKFTCLTGAVKDNYEIKIIGTKGCILLDKEKAWFLDSEDAFIDDNNAIKVEQRNPTKQALIDFRDSIVYDLTPKSDIISSAKTAVCIQMGVDALRSNTVIQWNTDLGL